VPGTEHDFLINPYGLLFEEITASSLVKIDLDGKKLLPSPYEINPAGFTIHSAIHAARADVQCVLHTHSLNGVAVSASSGGVLPLSQQSIFVLASLGYHDYEGVALRDDEKPRLVRDLGRSRVPDAAQPRPADGRASPSPTRSCACTCSRRPARSRSAPRPAALLRKLDRIDPGYRS
jgi:hypothetical protein